MRRFIRDVDFDTGVKLENHLCDHLRVGVVGSDVVCKLGGVYQWRRPSFNW